SRAKTFVQLQLLLTEKEALVQGGVIQISQVYRFLDFVRIVPGEENKGHLRLEELYPLRLMRVGLCLEQSLKSIW
ncbi:MAG: hypothetical protein U9Q17_00315, partial [Chloroflexota bacterium]|nr:hypothetical protein [Chloroflexota bacterium]